MPMKIEDQSSFYHNIQNKNEKTPKFMLFGHPGQAKRMHLALKMDRNVLTGTKRDIGAYIDTGTSTGLELR